MSTEPESFLARWSRRKREVERKAEQPAEPVMPVAPAAEPALGAGAGDITESPPTSAAAQAPETAPAADAPLPPIDSLDGVRSDYQAFFQTNVSEDLRRAALKKLFADPHFNQMDMLDVYVDDYTQFEPLTPAMRMRLPSARDFLLDSERAALDAAEGTSGTAPKVTAERPDASAESPSASASKPTAEAEEVTSTDEIAQAADAASSPTPQSGEAPRDSTPT
jgi:hypothetical protein